MVQYFGKKTTKVIAKLQVTNPSRNIKAVFGAGTSNASEQFMLCASSASWFYGFRHQQVTISDLDDNLHISNLWV